MSKLQTMLLPVEARGEEKKPQSGGLSTNEADELQNLEQMDNSGKLLPFELRERLYNLREKQRKS